MRKLRICGGVIAAPQELRCKKNSKPFREHLSYSKQCKNEMQILACCDNSLTIPQYCKSLRMRCSIVRSTWHAFETDSTKMIAQHPRFDLETARMKFHTRGGLRKSQKSSTGFQATHKRSTDENTVFFHPIHVAESKSCVTSTLGAQTHFKTHTENDQGAVE